jgi:hypothetical protein
MTRIGLLGCAALAMSCGGGGGGQADAPPVDDVADPGGFPEASNTGVPAGTTLTDYTGPMMITVDGTVIDGKTITGDLRVRATDVVVKNSKIHGDVRIDPDDAGTAYSFTVQDSEIDAGDVAGNDAYDGTGIGDGNFTAIRVNVHGGKRSIACLFNCTVRDSWLHDQAADATGVAHESAIRMGDGATIIHNTLLCNAPTIPPDAGCSADLTGYGDFAVIQNNLIQNNLFKATTGGTCAYGGSSAGKPFSDGANNIRFVENTFERGTTPSDHGTFVCGYYFPITDFDSAAPGNAWTGNVWDDGTALDL